MPESTQLASLDTPLQSLIAMGGPVMYVLLGLALVGTLTFFYLVLTGALYAPRSGGRVKQDVAKWKQTGAENPPPAPRAFFARCNPMHELTRRAMVGVANREPLGALRETVAQGAQKALQPFEAPLKIIEVIAALAPLLGLLGTVMGMMEAFSAMATTEGRASASQLSGGIYEALTTTAAGLIIAIPFAAIAAWVEFRLRRLNSQMNERLLDILNASPAVQSPVAQPSAQNRSRPVSEAGGAAYTGSRVAHATG
ncbi:outer membrane transport energization protein ExbB [Marinobacter daqiaonensis]|uniref:Outer membrane transport energization protein ExbB n=1 Tax=Marinobacter daqiaonensis TaxID=650891 RepID=A0A1I6IJR0_9GAMM|nr:MotA/TolQ/ExbB proton channel family protein [Marinobacter daqiaonensis]SFR66921.1 outer membrane transport energization protein ExbB [Marinobacter daqiaonensis]